MGGGAFQNNIDQGDISETYDKPQAPEFLTIIGSRLINKSNIVIQSCITLILSFKFWNSAVIYERRLPLMNRELWPKRYNLCIGQ